MKKYQIVIENWQGDTSVLQMNENGGAGYSIDLQSKGKVEATFGTQEEAQRVGKELYNLEQEKIQAETKNLSTAPAWTFDVIEIEEERE